MIERLMDSDIG